jgi:hypothetical protein
MYVVLCVSVVVVVSAYVLIVSAVYTSGSRSSGVDK